MSNILHRHCHKIPPRISGGEGVYLFDNTGKSYLDGCGGAAVSCLGHNHKTVTSAMKKQLEAIPYAHTGFFTSDVAEQLAEVLSLRAPDSLNHTYFVSGGSEAVESALKLARQYFVETGQPSRNKVISRYQSYHGNTLGALAAGGNRWRREPFSPLLVEHGFISPCYSYRNRKDGESEFEYGLRMAQELEDKLLEMGPENVMAFIAEPVVGATAGALTAERGYFYRIRQICDRYGVLLILDEVMCGCGRTGTYFAFEQEAAVPDLVTMAKGLAAGYQPIGAVMVADHIYEAISSGSGFFQHGHTFMAHPIACAAALATLQVIDNDDLLSQVARQGRKLFAELSNRFADHLHVGDIRGRGLFLGIELVENRETKAPFPSDFPLHNIVKKMAMDRGLMVYPMGGTIDGRQGHHILLAPPFIIQDDHIEELIDKLALTIDDATHQFDRSA
ncbi:aspartate aminotransferase family protein [Parasalinivibrio latis]|uniref:aspartate aminotransferase family protein n=1 Tax=Parasalinivibrio latis TaxID=2952610 RepID=UPI0030E2DD75